MVAWFSVRVHDPRVVETGIEVSSLLSAFPGHPLSAANSASFSDTIHIPGTDVASDARETNGVCPHLHLDTTESALTLCAYGHAPLLADAVSVRT